MPYKIHSFPLWLGVVWLLTAPALSAQAQEPIRVLFVGNSYIYYNNLPAIFEGFAASKGKTVDAAMHVRGGATLQRHVDEGIVAQTIATGDWDYVVLQEQSTLSGRRANGKIFIGDPERFHTAARALDSLIQAAGAQTVFMLTWARAFAPDTQPDLTQAYRTIAHELNAEVAPVGPAWLSLHPNHRTLYHEDQSHPGPQGSYLAAAVFYTTLFEASPIGAAATIQGFPTRRDGTEDQAASTTLVSLYARTAAQLQQTAWETYQSFHADNR